jgi:hypothetical protein
MSRGPGRVERIIIAAFTAQPSACFTMQELAPLVYPWMSPRNRRPRHSPRHHIEKKHRVAILRAAKNVLPKLGWGHLKASLPGGPPVFFNTCDFASWGRALTRCAWYYDPDQAEEVFTNPFNDHWRERLALDGHGARYVEAAQLRRDGKTAGAEVIEQRLHEEYRMVLAQYGIVR